MKKFSRRFKKDFENERKSSIEVIKLIEEYLNIEAKEVEEIDSPNKEFET